MVRYKGVYLFSRYGTEMALESEYNSTGSLTNILFAASGAGNGVNQIATLALYIRFSFATFTIRCTSNRPRFMNFGAIPVF